MERSFLTAMIAAGLGASACTTSTDVPATHASPLERPEGLTLLDTFGLHGVYRGAGLRAAQGATHLLVAPTSATGVPQANRVGRISADKGVADASFASAGSAATVVPSADGTFFGSCFKPDTDKGQLCSTRIMGRFIGLKSKEDVPLQPSVVWYRTGVDR